MAEFLLLPFGSAGDTFPFIGLGQQLQQRGHKVRVAGNGYFRPHVREAGLTFDELGSKEDYLDQLKDPNLWHPTRGFKAVVGHPKMAEMVEEQHAYVIEQFTRNPQIVVAAGSLAFGARIAHETHGLKLVTLHLSPTVFLSIKNPPRLPNMTIPSWWPRAVVRSMYWLGHRLLIDPTMNQVVGKYRQELRLPRIKNYFFDWIHSRELVLGLWPDWFAEPASDWPRNTRLTGFPLFDNSSPQPLNEAALQFIKGGPLPIVATFGTAMTCGQKLFQTTVETCTALNLRAILLTSFSEQVPASLPPFIKRFDFLPLSQLLPYSTALVHHGGIGTTSQALCAGVPQIVTPLAHDQFDNAERVRSLGTGVCVPAAKISTKRLTAAFQQTLGKPEIREKAVDISSRFHGQQAFAPLVETLEQFGARRPSTKYWV